MLDFGQEKRAKSGSRGSEAAVQSPAARNFTNLVQNYTIKMMCLQGVASQRLAE